MRCVCDRFSACAQADALVYIEMLSGLYEAIFTERFPAMDALCFDSNGWGDHVRVLQSRVQRSSCPLCCLVCILPTYLHLVRCTLVPQEITALCKVLEGIEEEPGGCQTKQLWLSHNDISDEGMRVLARCLGGGAMPALEHIHIYGNARAGLASRESIRKARPTMQVHYDGMGGGRENHAV